jgi:plasmid maintenance system antidote protein VapI
MDPIQPGTLLTRDQTARVEAALRLRHLTQKDYAAMEQCSPNVLNQIIRGKRAATGPYADRLNRLVRLHLIKPVQMMRLAA